MFHRALTLDFTSFIPLPKPFLAHACEATS
jgi:hypothetical protein